MMQAQTRLFTCDDCVRLNGCSEVLLTQGKQDHIQTCPEKPATMWCKVQEKWTRCLYVLLKPHVWMWKYSSKHS